MYAIVEIAGQQFKVAKDQKLFVHRLADAEGAQVSFDQVYLLDDGQKVNVGAPAITGASVEATVVRHLKGDKVIVFKKKRRKGYRVKNGHRQALTELMVNQIQATGSSPKAKSKPAEAKPKTKVAEEKPKAAPKPKAVEEEKVAVTTTDYSKMTVSELKAIAKQREIKGYTSLKKAELIAAIEAS